MKVGDEREIEIRFRNFYTSNFDYLHKFLDNLSFNYSLIQEKKELEGDNAKKIIT